MSSETGGLGRVPAPSCVPLTHAASCPSFNRVLLRPPSRSDKGKLTLRSNNPFFRSTAVRPTPSGTSRIGSGRRTVTGVPSSLRRRVITGEQRWQSQKYSTRLDSDERSAGSLSSRKSLPSLREWKEAEQDGLQHLATTTTPLTSPQGNCQPLYSENVTQGHTQRKCEESAASDLESSLFGDSLYR